MELRRLARGSIGIVAFLLLWEVVPRSGWVDTQFAPPLSVVIGTAVALLREGTLLPHVIVSLWRAGMGLAVAAAVALPAGLALAARWPRLEEDLGPLMRLLGQVNPFSLMPVFLLFFGIGETAKIGVLAWVCLWPVLHHTVNGVHTIDADILRSARSMGISGPAFLFRVLLPATSQSILAGLRTGAGLVFFMLIGAEMIGTGAGLGWFMHNAGATYQVPRIYASGALIVLLGVLLHGALGAIEKLRFRPRRLFTATALFLVALAAGAQPVLEIDRLGADASHGPHHGCGSVDLDRVNPADLERIGREMVEGRR